MTDLTPAGQALLDGHDDAAVHCGMGHDLMATMLYTVETLAADRALAELRREDCMCGHGDDPHYTGCLECERYGRNHADAIDKASKPEWTEADIPVPTLEPWETDRA